jgi:hypothetical protein
MKLACGSVHPQRQPVKPGTRFKGYWTRRSNACHRRSGQRLCSAFWKARPSGRPPPSCGAKKERSPAGWRGRQRLQQQLSRRGIELLALLAALCVAEGASKAAVPATLAQAAVRAGVLAASGNATGTIAPHVAALAAGVIGAMFIQKAKIAGLVLLTIGLFAAGAGALTHQVLAVQEQPVESQKSQVKSPEPLAAEPLPKPPVADVKPPAPDDKDAIAYAGRLLGPDGTPVPGAKLYLAQANFRSLFDMHEPPEVATTGPDGRFQFTAAKSKFGEHVTVMAAKPNHRVGWLQFPAEGKKEDFTLRLVQDDVPITGQIIDLEGRPVPNATLCAANPRVGR